MRTCYMPMLCIAFTAILAAAEFASADEPLKVEQLPLTAADISGVTGLNIYKYRIEMKPGTKFDVVVSVLDSPDAKSRILNRNQFTSDADAKAVQLLLSFLPRDSTMRGVLLSQDEEISYRIDCPQCTQTGMATVISLPLSDIAGTRKILIPMTADRSPMLSGENEICLVAILAKDDAEAASLQKSYPRAKVSVVLAD